MSAPEIHHNTNITGDGAYNAVEPNMGSGRRITLSEITNHYFPEGTYPPREQMRGNLFFINSILQRAMIPMSLSADSYLPLLNNHTKPQSQQYDTDFFKQDHRQNAVVQFLKQNEGPKLTFHIAPGEDYSRLEEAVQWAFPKSHNSRIIPPEMLELSPDQFGLPEQTRIFKMTDPNDVVTIHTLVEKPEVMNKTPYLIIEEDHDVFEIYSKGSRRTFKIAVDTTDDDPMIQRFTKLRTLLTVAVHNGEDYTDTHSSWDRSAEWRFDGDEPYAQISHEALRHFSEPLWIMKEQLTRIEKVGGTFLFFKKYDGTTIPQIQEREIRPYYYFDLMMKAANTLYQAVIAGNEFNGKAITEETLQAYREEFERLNLLFEEEFRHSKHQEQYYTPIEYLMYEMIQSGNDIWRHLDDFTYIVSRAVDTNPALFWKTFRALGLDLVVPHFRRKQKDRQNEDHKILLKHLINDNVDDGVFTGLESFCYAYDRVYRDEGVKSEGVVDIWTRVMSLFPELSPYYDRQPGNERIQSDEYYMRVVFPMAYYALQVGTEPISSLIVQEGIIIGSAYNLPKEDPDDFDHAEDLAIKRAYQYLKQKKLKPTKWVLYGTAESCTECSAKMRKTPITRAVFAIKTEMGGETQIGPVLTSPKLTRQKKPYGEPVEVVFGIFEDEARHLYRDIMGWTDFVL